MAQVPDLVVNLTVQQIEEVKNIDAENSQKYNVMSGASHIMTERQVHALKGWTAEHDDTHTGRELAKAALCYLLAYVGYNYKTSQWWPFSKKAKFQEGTPNDHKDRLDYLITAGSFVAAEIDRVKRMRLKERADKERAEAELSVKAKRSIPSRKNK